MTSREQSERQQCGHQNSQRRNLKGDRGNFQKEIGQDVEPACIVAQETSDFLEEVDDEVDRHQAAEAHREDFSILAKEIAEENGHGLPATHDIKPDDGGQSEEAVRHPGSGEGRKVCRGDQKFAADIQHVVKDDDEHADRKSTHTA